MIMLGGLEEDLHQLNDQFLKTVKEKNVKVMSWGEELLSNYGVMLHIVPPDTANPGKNNFKVFENFETHFQELAHLQCLKKITMEWLCRLMKLIQFILELLIL